VPELLELESRPVELLDEGVLDELLLDDGVELELLES